MATGWRSLPRATRVMLVLLVLATVLRGLSWTVALPLWQTVDEQSHYAYVEGLADGDYPPSDEGGSASDALIESLEATAYGPFFFRRWDRPLTPELAERLPPERPGVSTEAEGAFGARNYPPLYYALLVPVYALPGLDTATDRAYALRCASVAFGAVFVLLTFFLLRDVVADDRLCLLGAALLSLAPNVTQSSASISPDIALAMWSVALSLSCLRLARGVTPRRLLATAVLAAATAFTKPVGPAVAAVVIVGLAVMPFVAARVRRVGLALTVLGVATMTALFLLAFVRLQVSMTNSVGFALSYMWQFYLPPLSFMQPIFDPADPLTNPVPAWPIWIRNGVGWLGWLQVALPGWAYVVGAVSLLIATVLPGGALLVRRETALRRYGWVVPGALFAVVAFMWTLHVSEMVYMLAIVDGPDRLLHARYALPVTPLVVLLFVAGLALLPRRLGSAVAGGLVVLWLVVSAVALDAILQFFAT